MDIKKSALLGAVLAGSVTMSLSAFAGGYVGVSMGNTDFDAPEDGSSYELKGGYKFNDNFAIQGSYINFGDIDDNEPPVWTMEVDAIELSAIGSFLLSDKISLTGTLGFSSWDAAVTEEGFGNVGGIDGTDLFYGVGVSYSISDTTSFEFLYKDYDVTVEGEDLELTNISAGLNFHF